MIYNVTVVIILLLSIGWVSSKFIHLGNVEYTDNAQIKQSIVPVNSRIQGFITKVYFDEYQNVRKGDTLLVIENTEFRYRLAQAEADYQNALVGNTAMRTTVNTTQNNILVSDAGILEIKVSLDNAKLEDDRYANLYEQKAVTKQQYDAIKTNYEALQARYDLANRQKESVSLTKKELTERLDQTIAGIKLTEAAVELARLNLSYTVITAPCDGITGRKNIQQGQLIQPGQTIVDIVDSNDKWVVANLKETQTSNIALNHEVDILVDAIPGVTFKGYIKSISGATGASFSLVPQDNSSGNFVKVQQRIPVRIEFKNDNDPKDIALLRSGMNVECIINY